MTVTVRIFVDGDAFPCMDLVIPVAKDHGIPVEFYHNTRSVGYVDEYVTEHITDDKKDAVDYAILNAAKSGDIVLTNDAAFAGMCLAKKLYVLDPCGRQFSSAYINKIINGRYLTGRTERMTKHGGYALGKDDRPKKDFSRELKKIILSAQGAKQG